MPRNGALGGPAIKRTGYIFVEACDGCPDDRQIAVHQRGGRGQGGGRPASLPTPRMSPKHEYGVPPFRIEMRRDPDAGFTVVELLVTMAIIITIAAMAVPSLASAIDWVRVSRAVADIDTMESEIVEYQVTNGPLPDSLADIGRNNFTDPWGYPYEYLNHATVKGNGKFRRDRWLNPLNSDYDLYSVGKDGQSKPPITAKPSQDDVIRASDGSYVGLASQF